MRAVSLLLSTLSLSTALVTRQAPTCSDSTPPGPLEDETPGLWSIAARFPDGSLQPVNVGSFGDIITAPIRESWLGWLSLNITHSGGRVRDGPPAEGSTAVYLWEGQAMAVTLANIWFTLGSQVFFPNPSQSPVIELVVKARDACLNGKPARQLVLDQANLNAAEISHWCAARDCKDCPLDRLTLSHVKYDGMRMECVAHLDLFLIPAGDYLHGLPAQGV